MCACCDSRPCGGLDTLWSFGLYVSLKITLIDSTIVIFVNICIFSKLFIWKIHLSNQNIRFCTRNTILVPSGPHFRQISLILDPLGSSWSSKRFLGRSWGPPRDPLGAPRGSQTTPWELQEDPKTLLGRSKMLPRDSKWRHVWPPGPYQKSTQKYDTKIKKDTRGDFSKKNDAPPAPRSGTT